MKRIKYFSYYGCLDPERIRYNSPAADTKIDYIIEVINHIGYGVDHISSSLASTSNFQSGFVEKKDSNTFRYFASFGRGGSVLLALNRRFVKLQLFLWCLFNLKRNEQILVYHSLGYNSLFIILKKFKSLRIIGEIEELYQDVSSQKKSKCVSEYRFIDKCDAYIFPTNLLVSKLNNACKPYVLVHGIYAIEPSRNVKWNDDDIHVVYAGTFDPNKGGVDAAAAAEFLPKGYHIHICGFGNEQDTNAIIKTINITNSKSEASVTYDGFMNGEEFIRFLQKCQIGLSTQNPDAAFNSTSFPSKILTYLSNGLNVVCIRIPAVEYSCVGDVISYYDVQTPREIARAIMNCSCKEKTYNLLRRLHENFEKELRFILSNNREA